MPDERDPLPNPERPGGEPGRAEAPPVPEAPASGSGPEAETSDRAPAPDSSPAAEAAPAPPGTAAEEVPAGAADGYQIKLPVFEGPLDLLLFLIKKKKVEIHDIPIAVITREYLDYLRNRELLNIDREAEFILMAALLIFLKSQTLLPREQVLEPDIELRKASYDHLLPFQQIKAVAGVLRDKEEEQAQVWQRTVFNAPLPDQDLDLVEVSLFDLAESFFAMMKRKQEVSYRVVKGHEISLADMTNEIVEALRTRGVLDFLDYLWERESMEEALVAFFCLLELIKARVVMAIQEQLFHTIKVWLRKDGPVKGTP